jgi:hypothetical protein
MEPITVKGGKVMVYMEDGTYIHMAWNRSVRIEAEDAHFAMEAVNAVADGSEYPMLVDMATTESVSRQARAVFSIPCAASRIALLGASPVDRVLANFFISLHVPPCPTRFFTSRDDAMAWLLQEPAQKA